MPHMAHFCSSSEGKFIIRVKKEGQRAHTRRRHSHVDLQQVTATCHQLLRRHLLKLGHQEASKAEKARKGRHTCSQRERCNSSSRRNAPGQRVRTEALRLQLQRLRGRRVPQPPEWAAVVLVLAVAQASEASPTASLP